jgi:hypothetical protein
MKAPQLKQPERSQTTKMCTIERMESSSSITKNIGHPEPNSSGHFMPEYTFSI